MRDRSEHEVKRIARRRRRNEDVGTPKYLISQTYYFILKRDVDVPQLSFLLQPPLRHLRTRRFAWNR
ncbi:MAG: hypothetical protein WAT46_11960 [Saprospiraceae bacterium]